VIETGSRLHFVPAFSVLLMEFYDGPAGRFRRIRSAIPAFSATDKEKKKKYIYICPLFINEKRKPPSGGCA
jgi:hypothetical protein